jgi:hypothetical protein
MAKENVLNITKQPVSGSRDNIKDFGGTSNFLSTMIWKIEGVQVTTTGLAAKLNNLSSSANLADFVKMLGIKDILLESVGTWTTTRVAQGDYVRRKTATDETAIIGIDITEDLRTAANKGLKLASFDVIFRNTAEALDAHTVTLDRIEYTDSAVVSVNSIALTGALGTGVDADPQIDNVVIDTPAFNNTDDSKYVMELTVNAAASSVYDFIGIMLKFTRDDL